MPLIVRHATPYDSAAIAAIKTRVWPDETASEAQIVRIIQQNDHVTLIAEEQGRAAGFVDAFTTIGMDGCVRWEVDLLAVDPAYQGRKIGQQLIAAVTRAGDAFGPVLARALLQIENHACQGAMRRCGYTSDLQVYRLLIAADGREGSLTLPAGAHLIPVETMNYNGLWLEGALTPASFAYGRSECARRGCDLTGALIRADNAPSLNAALQAGYTAVESFHWWVFTGKNPGVQG